MILNIALGVFLAILMLRAFDFIVPKILKFDWLGIVCMFSFLFFTHFYFWKNPLLGIVFLALIGLNFWHYRKEKRANSYPASWQPEDLSEERS